jgi:methylglutamate dehydrogenase subunit D
MADGNLTPRSPFYGLSLVSAQRHGIVATDRDGLGLATVLVRKDHRIAIGTRVHNLFGIAMPAGPTYQAVGDIAFAGTAPGTWLAMRETGGNAFAESLEADIGDLASVSDQSSGYAILRLTGPKVRDALAKIVPIDLHPRAFPTGRVASTIVSHMGATLWRLEDTAEGAAAFEFAVFRSFAASVWHDLSEAAAEFGLAARE